MIIRTLNDKDIIFKGEDGGTTITALTLDISGRKKLQHLIMMLLRSQMKDSKTDIETIENGLEKLMKLRGVTYKRNDVQDAKTQIGVIAQEAEEVVPEVVKTASDEMGTKSVDYGKLTTLLIESVKELGKVVNNDCQMYKELKNKWKVLKKTMFTKNLSSYQ